jgi:hypothetical protein
VDAARLAVPPAGSLRPGIRNEGAHAVWLGIRHRHRRNSSGRELRRPHSQARETHRPCPVVQPTMFTNPSPKTGMPQKQIDFAILPTTVAVILTRGKRVKEGMTLQWLR